MKIKIIKTLAFVSLLLVPHISLAETHVYSKDIQVEWNWKKEASPYILEESIYIPQGHTLTISEGVEVISAVTDEESTHTLTIGGDLKVVGSKDDPVKFTDLYSLYFVGSFSSITHAIFQGTGLDFFSSNSTIKDSIIRDAFHAITARGSTIDISNSVLERNFYGVSSYSSGPVFPMLLAATTTKELSVNVKQNVIKIHDSKLVDNARFGILNQTTNTLDATDNWWGNAAGPEDAVSGLVLADPWLKKDPFGALCCSNVLFVPGIQASRLYKGSNMLWEPNRNDDVRKLFMNQKGVSIDQSISIGEIISSALGVKDIYKSFIGSMDTMVNEGLINEWLPWPYDWRRGAYDIVDKSFLDRAYKLASSSKTGKIILIAHSNGGLVAKALLKTLEEVDMQSIIEKSISVAVPELGTPQAILAMLHGDGQSIAGGLVLSRNTARSFSQNLPGAYGLLPSRKFFEKNPLTVISNSFSSPYGQSISTYQGMKDFLLRNSFSKASTTDINTPLSLNSYLLSLNESFHLIYDTWKPSSTTKTLSVFGWGIPTSKSVAYEKDVHCKSSRILCDLSMSRTITSAGDGTVMTASNSESADATFFFDLKKLKIDTKKEISHADIMESSQLQDFLKSSISDTSAGDDYKKYFSVSEPTDADKWLYIRVYSPVDIDIYDKDGNHTGLIRNQGDASDAENYETTIPSSVYDGWGRTKQVILPYDQEYDILLSGTGDGVFSIEAEVVQGETILASTTFSEMPVNPLMKVDFSVGTSTDSFASSTVMYVDMNGDGTSETVHNSDQFLKANSKNRKYRKEFRKSIRRLFHKVRGQH